MTEKLGELENFEWYGEWVFFDNDEEKKEAEEYLRLWKKFILKRLHPLVCVDTQIIEKKIEDYQSFNGKCVLEPKGKYTLGIKIQMGKEMTEEYEAPEELRLFFTRLLDIKKFTRESAEVSDAQHEREILMDIYERIDAIIKESK